MAKIVTFHSFRRGTGKTSLAANTAVLCAQLGMRVGLVDLNLQCPSLTYTFQIENRPIPYRINDFIWQTCTIDQTAYDITAHIENLSHTNLPGKLIIVPASTQQADIQRTIKGTYDYDTMDDGLLDLISTARLDVLILDTRAGINDDTLFALAISDLLLIIMRPDQQDYQGTAVTVNIAHSLEVPQANLIINNAPNKFDPADVQRKVEAAFDCKVAAVIPFSTDLASMEHPGILALEHPRHPIIRTLEEMIIPHVRP